MYDDVIVIKKKNNKKTSSSSKHIHGKPPSPRCDADENCRAYSTNIYTVVDEDSHDETVLRALLRGFFGCPSAGLVDPCLQSGAVPLVHRIGEPSSSSLNNLRYGVGTASKSAGPAVLKKMLEPRLLSRHVYAKNMPPANQAADLFFRSQLGAWQLDSARRHTTHMGLGGHWLGMQITLAARTICLASRSRRQNMVMWLS